MKFWSWCMHFAVGVWWWYCVIRAKLTLSPSLGGSFEGTDKPTLPWNTITKNKTKTKNKKTQEVIWKSKDGKSWKANLIACLEQWSHSEAYLCTTRRNAATWPQGNVEPPNFFICSMIWTRSPSHRGFRVKRDTPAEVWTNTQHLVRIQ